MPIVYGYLSIPGIKGSVQNPAHAGKIPVVAVNHEVATELDEISGQPTGHWQHKPLVITKPLDLSTPKLHEAMESKNPLASTVTLEFWRDPPGGGPQERHYSIALTDARVAFIRTVKADVRLSNLPDCEEVGLTYKLIAWGWNSGGHAEGTDPAESSDYVATLAPFAVPDEVALRAMILGLIQSIIGGVGSELADAAAVVAGAPQPK